MCDHRYPTTTASGHLENGEWKWEKTEWVLCKCGFNHSNRIIPDEFWKQWKNTPTTKSLNYSSGIILVRNCEPIDDIPQVFLTQAYHNCYGLPKGKNYDDENPLIGALREFKEETGCDLEKEFPQKDFTECEQITFYDDKKRTEYTFFVVDVDFWFDIKTKPEDDVEITSFGWRHFDDLTDLKLTGLTKKILKL